MRTAIILVIWASSCLAQQGSPQSFTLPNKPDSLKFAVFGDTGTGDKPQFEVAKRAAEYHAQFPFTFAIMLGDNMYGGEGQSAFEKKFERPYKPLLEAGVKFYASLGNHDNPNQRSYKHFNMNGERYYSFKPKAGVRLFSLDSNYVDKDQLSWLTRELESSGSDWKIAFFHHPLYSSGEKHGPDEQLRSLLEPLFVKHGVHVVFTGHEHFYERLKPQQGIHHWVAGSSAKLRRGNIGHNQQTAKGFDRDQAFMLIEIDGDTMYFQAISRAGATIDWGVLKLVDNKAQLVRSAS